MAALHSVRLRVMLALALLGLSAAGCRPDIGDECITSLDCSSQGDRLCDTSQPEGYCTIFGCEPDACPDNSVCVGFGLQIDPACAESNDTDPRWPRFERTFCLHVCETNDDCRDGYTCIAPTDRGGVSIDIESELSASPVCFVADGGAVEPASEPPPSCSLPADYDEPQ